MVIVELWVVLDKVVIDYCYVGLGIWEKYGILFFMMGMLILLFIFMFWWLGGVGLLM